MESASWLMLCGSIPPGVSTDFYTKLIRMARERKVKTLLDTDGDALLHGIEAGPTLVSPNQPEAERLLNRALITRAQFLEAATRIKAMGAEAVMLSLGGRGVVAVNENQLLEVIPPRTDAASPLGSGDALAAAYVWAATKKKDFADCVRWAVAAGTASAMQPGLVFANLEQTKEVFKSVEVRRA
jgi:1-phosphofructokinase family hexose kinase